MLVPCYPTGVLYDLLECLSGHLDSRGLASVRSDRNILTRKISILYDTVVVFFRYRYISYHLWQQIP